MQNKFRVEAGDALVDFLMFVSGAEGGSKDQARYTPDFMSLCLSLSLSAFLYLSPPFSVSPCLCLVSPFSLTLTLSRSHLLALTLHSFPLVYPVPIASTRAPALMLVLVYVTCAATFITPT